MHIKNERNEPILRNLIVLCDVEVILGIPCILTTFECVHALIKIAHSMDVFVCEFVEFVKLAHQKLYWFHCDLYVNYEDHGFDDSNFITTLTNDNLYMSWFSNLNGSVNVVYFSSSFVD
jgi:hypothetical protein